MQQVMTLPPKARQRLGRQKCFHQPGAVWFTLSLYHPHLEAGARRPQEESAETVANLEKTPGAGPFLCQSRISRIHPNGA